MTIHVTKHAVRRGWERFNSGRSWVEDVARRAIDIYKPQQGVPETLPLDDGVTVVVQVHSQHSASVVTVRKRNMGDWRFKP